MNPKTEPQDHLSDVIYAMQMTIDSSRKETNRICGLLRMAREIIWDHHAYGVMEPDTCPICAKKEVRWLYEQMEDVL